LAWAAWWSLRALATSSGISSPVRADSFGDTMLYNLDPDDITAIRTYLGLQLGELRRTMLDVDTPPIFLFSDDRPRLVAARTRTVEILNQWIAQEPTAASKIYVRYGSRTYPRGVR
jgi:hypothetical protein